MKVSPVTKRRATKALLIMGSAVISQAALEFDEDTNDDFCGPVLRCLFTRLPKLRHVLFDDYRELAFVNESDSELRERLFGNTLPPADFRSYNFSTSLLTLLQSIQTTPNTLIQSFSIGGHPHDTSLESTTIVKYTKRGPYSRKNFPGPTSKLCNMVLNEAVRGGLDKLKNLHLIISFAPYDAVDPNSANPVRLDAWMRTQCARVLVQTSAQSFVKLSLYTPGLVQDYHESNEDLQGVMKRLLAKFLLTVKFAALYHLDLRGWLLSPNRKLQRFFSEHSSTLREICLVGCRSSDDPRELGRWAGKAMNLEGVRLNLHLEWHCPLEDGEGSLEEYEYDGLNNGDQNDGEVLDDDGDGSDDESGDDDEDGSSDDYCDSEISCESGSHHDRKAKDYEDMGEEERNQLEWTQ